MNEQSISFSADAVMHLETMHREGRVTISLEGESSPIRLSIDGDWGCTAVEVDPETAREVAGTLLQTVERVETNHDDESIEQPANPE